VSSLRDLHHLRGGEGRDNGRRLLLRVLLRWRSEQRQGREQHLALERGAVAGEGVGRDVEAEAQGEEELQLQAVHLRHLHAADAREVGVVLVANKYGKSLLYEVLQQKD
jgi:hypothetical protein